MKTNGISRRSFLQSSAVASAALMVGAPVLTSCGDKKVSLTETCINPKNVSCFRGVQIGAITYSYRDQSNRAGDMLLYALAGGVGSLELMGDAAATFTGSPDINDPESVKKVLGKYTCLGKLFRQQGVDVHIIKSGVSDDDKWMKFNLDACAALGAAGITTELDERVAKEIAPKFEEAGKYLIFHNHGQPSEANFPGWDAYLKYSKAAMLNFDAGHYFGFTGNNPCDVIQEYHDRIYSIHMKDKTAPTADPGNFNKPWGEGGTPIAEVLELLAKNAGKADWPHHVDIELEYDVPAGSTPCCEVRKCVDFARNILK